MTEPSDLDTALEAFTKETELEFSNANLDEAIETAPAADDPGVSAHTTAAELTKEASDLPADSEGAVKPPEPDARGFERLVAREVEVRSKEVDVARREAQITAYEARIKDLEGRVLPQNVVDELRRRPRDLLTKMGLDPDQVIKMAIAQKLGKEAPPELQADLRSADHEHQLEELRNELRQRDQVAEAQRFVASVEAGARDFMAKALGDSKDAPTVASVAKTAPDRVHKALMEEIANDARVKAQRDSRAPLMTYEEAAKRVESKWFEFRSLFSPAPETKPTTPPPASTPVKKQAETPAVKPPDRPLAPWLQRGSLEDEGVQAGIMEFKRLNTKP